MAGKTKGISEDDLEAMSDDDRRAYLESESEDDLEADSSEEEEGDDEEEETPPADQGVEADEQTQDETDPQAEVVATVPGGNPSGALKAKNAEIKALKAQLAEQGGKVDQLTSLVATFMAQGMTQKEAAQEVREVVQNAQESASAEDPEPDFEDDPVAWASWLKRQSTAAVEAVQKEFNDYRNQVETTKATTALQDYEARFAEANPDYYQVVNLSDPNNDLTAYYAKNPAVYAAHMASEDPVKEAYDFGKARLIAQGIYKTPKGAPPAARTPAVVKGKQAPPSLAAVPASRERIEQDYSDDLTEEQVAGLSEKERARYLGRR